MALTNEVRKNIIEEEMENIKSLLKEHANVQLSSDAERIIKYRLESILIKGVSIGLGSDAD